MQQPPAIPPRPSRDPEQDNGSAAPTIPPRPKKQFQRSISPNPDRFAPSPLNEPPFAPKSPGRRTSGNALGVDPIERPGSVTIPSIGQEGQEYAAFDELNASSEDQENTSPEQTRTVGEDVKLHAPKPKLAQEAAIQRVAAVTRTDSERAASFGIGRPSSEDPFPRTLKKKASTTSQLSHDSHADDDHGIPEIGIRVPLLGNAGDIQAPTPGPGATGTPDAARPRQHSRRSSGRGFGQLPPDSYGLHGHGVEHTDKLEKAYYEKHPEAKKHDLRNHHLHDRVKDYSMSSEDLNKLVRDSGSRGAVSGASDYVGTPSEQVGFYATEEYTSRMSSPRPPSAASKRLSAHMDSPLKVSSTPGISLSGTDGQQEELDDEDEEDDDVIHVDDPAHRKGFAKYGNAQQVTGDATDDYDAPILASDEVAKGPSPYHDTPAVEPPPERRGSTYEMERPKSRPNSRPSSVYSPPLPEIRSTSLNDVEEYEPLPFRENEAEKKAAAKAKEHKQRFPSRDIWEDAPDSAHGTAEVSTPEPTGAFEKPEGSSSDIVPREGETAAQAFARRQEELAESEDRNPDSFLRNRSRPRSWAEAQPHLAKEMNHTSRPTIGQRFPSRDVWEDTPDSLRLETTVSTPQSDKDPQSATGEESPVEKHEKPAIPARPAKKYSGDDKPSIPDRPKPQIPARPGKSAAADSREAEAAPKQKPAVPARPMGSKIAALQAGFMSDLNKRLATGPSAPKKEEPKDEEVAEEKEKAPLADARKGRARGPQRRAPTKSSSPSGTAPPISNGRPTLSFSTTRTLWCIDEEGTMSVEQEAEPSAEKSAPVHEVKEVEEPAKETVQEISKPAETASEPSEPSEVSEPTASTTTETKTLATNTAGDSIVEETVEKSEGDQVSAVGEVKDDVVDS
ncbi:Nuclear transport factor 2 [Pestalotiopsis sp. IQ-011]